MIGPLLLMLAFFLYVVWVEVDALGEWLAVLVATPVFIVGGVLTFYGV